MQVVLALHIIFMVAWFAGLFYLPRLFVYHADATDIISCERFKVMERRLFNGIMTPAAVLTVIFGFWLISYHRAWYFAQAWMDMKLVLVFILLIYHVVCGRFVADFKHNCNRHTALFFRFFNEIPTLLLVAIVFLVILRP